MSCLVINSQVNYVPSSDFGKGKKKEVSVHGVKMQNKFFKKKTRTRIIPCQERLETGLVLSSNYKLTRR